MRRAFALVILSAGAAGLAAAPLFAQSLTGSSDQVILIPSGQTEAGPIDIFVDNDVDGMSDEFEAANGLDPTSPLDALQDPDADQLTNLVEFRNRTNPRNPDTDGDGTDDGSEVLLGTDPLDPASGGSNVSLVSLRLIPSFGSLTLNSFTALSQATLQVRLEGALSDGSTVDLTRSSTGTTYTVADPAIATVDAEGLLTARAPGAVAVEAANRDQRASMTVAVNTFTPQALGFVAIPGFANNVALQGGFAYVAAGSMGLTVVDVADPRNPRIVATLDTPGNANDVDVGGNLACVADGAAGLQVIDISDPAHPRTVAAVETPGTASDVVLKGDYAYVADGTAGLQVVDLRDPAAARIAGSVDTPGTAFGVDVHELRGVAVVADGFSVQVVDIRDPAHPMLRGAVPVAGSSGFGAPPAVDVAVSGVFAVVAAGITGVVVVDVRDPAAPRIIGGTAERIDAQDVAVVGSVAFAAEDIFVNAVPLFDLRNLAAPPFIGALDFSRAPSFRDDNGTGVAVSNGLIFLTGDRFQLTQNGVAGNSALHIGQYTQFNDNGINAPFVRILSPADGAAVLEGQAVSVTVEARDDVTVALVELLANGNVVRTFTMPPYAANVAVPLDITELTLGARASDLAGNVGLAGPVRLRVVEDPPPTVSLTSPPAGATLFEGQTVEVRADAADNLGVAEVIFDINGVMRTDTAAPYSTMFTIPLGTRDLLVQATARDTIGQTTSALRTVAVIPDPPPTVALTSPGEGATVVEGSLLRVSADASDNVRVDSVTFVVDGVEQPPDVTAPFTFQFVVPLGSTGLTLGASAVDNFGQRSTTMARFVQVIADPRTTVIGRVVDSDGLPVADAAVSVLTEFTGRTDVDGRFAIPGVLTARGDLVAMASATLNGVAVSGRSNPTPPVIGHETDVGVITLARTQTVFEENIGPCVLQGDDTFLPFNFAPSFHFPFMGAVYQGLFVGSNGYVTFTEGDDSLGEDVSQLLSGPPRIAALWDDLNPGVTGASCVHANSLEDRTVVTWNQVPEFSNFGMNTMQIILFLDGRIQIGYREMSATDGLVGVSPGGNPLFLAVDFTQDTPVDTPGPFAIFELFGGPMNNPLDLADTFLIFTPNAQNGYGVEMARVPRTTVRGLAVDEGGQPVVGALMSLVGRGFAGMLATTATDGSFTIPDVPTNRGIIQVRGQATRPDGAFLFGVSGSMEPVPGGVTDVGSVTLAAVQFPVGVFEPDLGTNLRQGDDDFDQVTIPFSFPYFGTDRTEAFVGSNGYVTFGGGDTTFGETVGQFLGPLPRISPFFDDLDPRVEPGDVFVNDQLPGRLVVTWHQVGEFPFVGSNTIQLTLFATGQVQFLYAGVMARDAIVGVTPGGSPGFISVDYSAQTPLSTVGPVAILEQFFGPASNPFDLDASALLFSPNANAGYDVIRVEPGPCVMGGAVEGTVTGEGWHPYAGVKVELTCSCDSRYHETTITDAHGRFRVEEAPVGAIHATAHNADGAPIAVAAGFMQGAGQALSLQLLPPADSTKP